MSEIVAKKLARLQAIAEYVEDDIEAMYNLAEKNGRKKRMKNAGLGNNRLPDVLTFHIGLFC